MRLTSNWSFVICGSESDQRRCFTRFTGFQQALFSSAGRKKKLMWWKTGHETVKPLNPCYSECRHTADFLHLALKHMEQWSMNLIRRSWRIWNGEAGEKRKLYSYLTTVKLMKWKVNRQELLLIGWRPLWTICRCTCYAIRRMLRILGFETEHVELHYEFSRVSCHSIEVRRLIVNQQIMMQSNNSEHSWFHLVFFKYSNICNIFTLLWLNMYRTVPILCPSLLNQWFICTNTASI